MKKLIAVLLLMTISAVYAATAPLNVSFVQMGHVAKLKVVDAKTGTYQLTLKRANPLITYFSDRPARVIGQESNEAFLQQWKQGKNSFANDAPNAVLNGSVRDDQQKKHFMNIAMILSAPHYDASKQQFTYTVHPIGQSKALPTVLYHPVMFIDNACLTCVG